MRLLVKLYVQQPDLIKRAIRRTFYFWLTIRFSIYSTFRGNKPVINIDSFNRKVFSQHGEDGIISVILRKIGTTNRFCVELGVGDGQENCTRYLVERQGWKYLWVDCLDTAPPSVVKEFITAENVNTILANHGVPEEFDLLSIDIDYNTYWVWKAMQRYRPRIVVIEYNGFLPPDVSKAVPYDPGGVAEGQYFGASLLAITNLAKSKGYELLGVDISGCNAFFVRSDLINSHFLIKTVKEAYKPAIGGHAPTNKPFVDV